MNNFTPCFKVDTEKVVHKVKEYIGPDHGNHTGNQRKLLWIRAGSYGETV